MTRGFEDFLKTTVVVIPAYNAGKHVRGVLEATSRVVQTSQIIVVDDGSSDDTLDAARSWGAIVEHHDVNQGKGAALQTGFRRAIQVGMHYVVTLDADGQHNPAEIPRFIEQVMKTGADIVVGDRMANRKDMPFIRVFANWATSAFVSLRAGTRIPDSQNGFRIHKTSLLQRITLETKRYDTESEVLIKAGRLGAHIASVPVETIYGQEKSSVNPFVDTLRFFRMVFRSLFW